MSSLVCGISLRALDLGHNWSLFICYGRSQTAKGGFT